MSFSPFPSTNILHHILYGIGRILIAKEMTQRDDGFFSNFRAQELYLLSSSYISPDIWPYASL